jgi:hypothetical protein
MALTTPTVSCAHNVSVCLLVCLLQGELDELEREEFFRLKKVQKNKLKVAARDLAAKEAAQVRDGQHTQKSAADKAQYTFASAVCACLHHVRRRPLTQGVCIRFGRSCWKNCLPPAADNR